MDNELKNGLPEEEENAVAEAQEETDSETEENLAEEEIAEADEEIQEDASENNESENESEEADEKIAEEELCIICGENKKGEESDYCPECEAAMYKSKIPVLAWLSGVAVICVSIFAFVVAALLSAPALQSARGDTYASQNRWYSAYLEYSQVSSVIDEINSIIGTETPFVQAGRGVTEKIIESYAKSRSPLDSIYIAMMNYGESALDKFKGISEYVEIYDDFYENYALMSESVDGMLAGATQAETFAALEALKGAEGVNEVYRNYFLFSAADFYNLGYKEELKYIEAADAAAKEQGADFSWLYYLEIADILCQEGEYDKALKYADVLAENDKNNYRAHDLKMRIALAKGDSDEASKILADFKTNNEGHDTAIALEAGYYRCLGDYEKSRLVCDEGLVENDFSTEIHRQIALLYLIEGNYSAAFEEAFTADSNASYMANYYMDSIGFTPQLDNAIYLCAVLCKNNNLMSSENSIYIDQIIEYYKEFSPSKQTAEIISGEKTAAEVLTEGAFDLA